MGLVRLTMQARCWGRERRTRLASTERGGYIVRQLDRTCEKLQLALSANQ